MVENPRSFVPGVRVDFLRANEPPGKGLGVIGSATVSMVDERFKIVKFDSLPDNVRVGDMIALHSGLTPGIGRSIDLGLERH